MKLKAGKYWDKAWNPVTGCTPISKACERCWAKGMAERFPQIHGETQEYETDWGLIESASIPFNEVNFHPKRLQRPILRKTPTIFSVCWMGDLFHKQVPTQWQHQVFDTIVECPQHRFLLLTKRPVTMNRYANYCHDLLSNFSFSNAWYGASACDERSAIFSLSQLKVIHDLGGKTWISLEPLLGPIGDALKNCSWLDWLVVGSESGSGARKCQQDWLETSVAEAMHQKIPVFVKQANHSGKLVKAPSEYPQQLPEALKIGGRQ